MSWSHTEQMYLEMNARMDPVSFVTHDYFLGRRPYPKQAEVFSAFYSNPKCMLLVIIAGMRGGKTRLAADIVCYEAFDLLTTGDIEKKYKLEEGSKFYIVCVATSEDQAEDTIFHEVKKSVVKSPFFKKFSPKVLSKEIRFEANGLEIKAGLSTAMGLVGRTVKCNVFDELSKLEKTEGKRSAELVYSLLSKSTTSFQFDGKNIVITSPMHTEDKAWRLYKDNKESPYAICLNIPTWEMNPNLPFEGEYMQAKLEEDPITFWRDYGAEPQSSTDKFYKDESILKFEEDMPNVFESNEDWDAWVRIQKRNPKTLILAGDPSGRMDSFGIALGYKEVNDFYIIGTTRVEPTKVYIESSGSKILDGKKPSMEVNPLEVQAIILSVADELRCNHIIFDTWNYPLLQKELTLKGCHVYNNVVKIGHYEVLRKIQYGDRIHVAYNSVLSREWKQLVQINARKIDHPKLGSKDIADSICNVIYVADEIVVHPWIPPMLVSY